MENMIEIRTPENNKLYGMLDIDSYALHIKENKFTRIIPIAKEGATVRICSESKFEEIYIPPKDIILRA